MISTQSCPTTQCPPVLSSAHPETPVHTTVCWCPREPPWWDCMHLGSESWLLDNSAHLGSWQIICFPFLLSHHLPLLMTASQHLPSALLHSRVPTHLLPVSPVLPTRPSAPSAPPMSPICPLPVSPHNSQSLPACLSALFLQNSFLQQDPKSPNMSSAPPVSPSESQYPLSTTECFPVAPSQFPHFLASSLSMLPSPSQCLFSQ